MDWPVHLYHLSYPGALWVPQDRARPEFQHPPLYPSVLDFLLVHVYQEVRLGRFSLGDLVFLWFPVFLVFPSSLLVLRGRACDL